MTDGTNGAGSSLPYGDLDGARELLDGARELLDGARELLDGARELLEAERAEATAAISALTRDFDGIVDAACAVGTDDEHDPEGATIAFERAQVASLLERARGRLANVDLALARIEDGSYGSCQRCGQPITAERLTARPAASTCIRCAATARAPRA